MLGPSKSAPDYDEQMKRFKADPSDWGTPADVVDMMKAPNNKPQPVEGKGSLKGNEKK